MNVENIPLPEMHRIYDFFGFFGSEKWLENEDFGFRCKMYRIYCNSKNRDFVENIPLPEMHRIYKFFGIKKAVGMEFVSKCIEFAKELESEFCREYTVTRNA
jgi:hypothetical protein